MLLENLRDLLMVSSAAWIVSRAFDRVELPVQILDMINTPSPQNPAVRKPLADAVACLIQPLRAVHIRSRCAVARGRVHVVQLGAGEHAARSLRCVDAAFAAVAASRFKRAPARFCTRGAWRSSAQLRGGCKHRARFQVHAAHQRLRLGDVRVDQRHALGLHLMRVRWSFAKGMGRSRSERARDAFERRVFAPARRARAEMPFSWSRQRFVDTRLERGGEIPWNAYVERGRWERGYVRPTMNARSSARTERETSASFSSRRRSAGATARGW